jgi:uncharacterized YccA/Bax inhibitor family protein
VNDLLFAFLYLVILLATSVAFLVWRDRPWKAAIWSGGVTSFVTTTIFTAFDQKTWNPITYLAAFLIYGTRLAGVSILFARLIRAGLTSIQK